MDSGIRELTIEETFMINGAFSAVELGGAMLGGAVAGGMAGSIAPGVGTVTGAVAGALTGGAAYTASELYKYIFS